MTKGNEMNRTAIWITALVALAAVVSLNIWSAHHRFYTATNSKGQTYEVDKKTGKSWFLYGGRKIEQEDSDATHIGEQPLPPIECAKVTGNAGLGYGSFSGKLFNGSCWVVTRIVVNVRAKEDDGSVRWSRDSSERVKIRPLETESFSVTVTGDDGIKDAPGA